MSLDRQHAPQIVVLSYCVSVQSVAFPKRKVYSSVALLLLLLLLKPNLQGRRATHDVCCPAPMNHKFLPFALTRLLDSPYLLMI